jgi:hypothetical protein
MVHLDHARTCEKDSDWMYYTCVPRISCSRFNLRWVGMAVMCTEVTGSQELRHDEFYVLETLDKASRSPSTNPSVR